MGMVAKSGSSVWYLTSTTYPRLEKYVRDVLGTFRNDHAILAWDLYNEPRNTTLPLVRKIFKWAREINPSQPLNHLYFWMTRNCRSVISENSDIITFHNYSPKEDVVKTIQSLKQYNRPIICTEWLNRPLGSTVESVCLCSLRKTLVVCTGGW